MDESMKAAGDLLGWMWAPIAAVVGWLARRISVLEARVLELDRARDEAVVAHARCETELAALKAAIKATIKAGGALALVMVSLGAAGCSPAARLKVCTGARAGCHVVCDGVVAGACDDRSGSVVCDGARLGCAIVCDGLVAGHCGGR